MEHGVLELFHPLVRKWFGEKVGIPTDVQIKTWPLIAEGGHVLITAPTGSGKTLTAFLWALQKLITGKGQGGQVRVLYVSPMKALNNDVQRNLLQPLQELREYFAKTGENFPPIQVLTRSGDTPQNERRLMQRRPPEILITTPESLNLLLSSKNSRPMLGGVETVILDEIHAVLDSKRGTHMITAVDRLVPLAGEFQRIALSATVRPLEPVASFVGGLEADWKGGVGCTYKKRPVTVIKSSSEKEYVLTVETVEEVNEGIEPGKDAVWQGLAARLTAVIRKNTSTLVFCNSRRTVEKLTRLINDEAGEPLVYSHHGSLARELRLVVEQKLKDGELKGIVATNSLELGIDIGDLDRVVLVQTPPSIASTIQRIGRAGHGVGQVSRGTIIPLFGYDYVEAAVASLNLNTDQIEPVSPVEGPLDVLAQVLISMTGVETWDIEELFAFLRTSYPYRHLSRKSFDLLLEMLSGHYSDTRLRELKPRIVIDKLDRTVKARDGAMRLLYLGGGTIPDRGSYDLRFRDTKAKIGQLDEEFVWERNIGDTFMLGNQVWRIVRVTHNDVEVIPGDRAINIIPFWRAEEQNRDFFYAEKIGLFLEEAEQNLDSESFAQNLNIEHGWSNAAASRLALFLQQQREVTGLPLPHRHHLLIEHINDPLNSTDSMQVILHTLWGGRINKPFALALAAAWEEKYACSLEMHVNNNSIMLMLPEDISGGELFSLVAPQNLEKLLRSKLESTGFFGARFRENAGTALLLPRTDFKKRMPLWFNRLRAKKMMAAVAPYADFPIMLETWRTCLRDEFDLESLRQLLEEISDGQISVSETVTHRPSPFAAGLIWQRTSKYMYEDDTPIIDKQSGLNRELLQELIYTPHLRPELPSSLLQELDGKLKRTAPGYAPEHEEELLLWLKERLFIPADETALLFAAIERDHNRSPADLKHSLGGKVAWLQLPGAGQPGLCALEVLPRLAFSLGLGLESLTLEPLVSGAGEALVEGLEKLRAFVADQKTGEWEEDGAEKKNGAEEEEALISDKALLVSQWLSYYGPVAQDFPEKSLGLSAAAGASLLDTLLGEESVVVDMFTPGATAPEICDRDNLERLFVMARRARRAVFEPLPPEKWPLFLASYQGIVEKGTTMDDLQDRIGRLFGFVVPVQLWEEAILPARMDPYYSAWTDSLMQASDLVWFGRGKKRVGLSFYDDIALYPPGSDNKLNHDHEVDQEKEQAHELFPEPQGKYNMLALGRYSGLSTEELTRMLWKHFWQGSIASDSLAVLRRGILNKFTPIQAEERRGFRKGTGFKRWSASRPLHGNWFLFPEFEDGDLIEQEELAKERIRQLFSRYGVLFPELLRQELPALQWRYIFRTLRLMEFSGEIYAGHFFTKFTGPQFASREAYLFIQREQDENCIYWINAADPASPCGFRLQDLSEGFPPRLPATYLVFHGSRLKVVARRNGKELVIKTGPDDSLLPAYFAFFETLLTRDFNPLKSVVVERINGESALGSPYKKVLSELGFSASHKSLELRRQY